MSWVRIHDGAMVNQKITALSDSAFRLWVRGLSYCQTALTDGVISRQALKDMGAKRRDVDQLAAVLVVGRSPLWEPHQAGFHVHDYLTWNDSRELVLDRQAGAKLRKEAYHDKRKIDQTLNKRRTFPERVPNATGTRHDLNGEPNQTKPNHARKEDRTPTRPRGEPPLNLQLGRLKIWKWMIEAFIAALGQHADAFHLDQWIADVDRAEQGVIVTTDWWDGYWKPAFEAEVKRRGLPLAAPAERDYEADERRQNERALAEVQRLDARGMKP